jgi:predicted DNA-binding protein
MATRTRARNPNELTEIINQALDEVEDLRAAIEYDEEFKGKSSIIVDPAAA